MTDTYSRRIGFVGTRFAGTDGVSLEAEKWADVLRESGHDVFYFGGIVERPPDRTRAVPEAFFGHRDNVAVNETVFGDAVGAGRHPDTSRRIEALVAHLKDELQAFVRDFGLDLLIAENALAIPMHLPLGLAITRLAAETGMPVLAHHHDLPWERQRFLRNAAVDIISAAFPPALPNVHHVCINSFQREEIARRIGRSARVIPNVMDFERLPKPTAARAVSVRAALGLEADELFVLQPVRMVPRKGVEHAVSLLARLERPARLIISHPSGDEGTAYEEHIRDLARRLGVGIVWAADRVTDAGAADGHATFTLADLYDAADLVTYTSLIEGFGNAYLEAVYHRRAVFVNRYPVYDLDIRPLGFRNLEMDGFLTGADVAATRHLLDEPERIKEWSETNYELGRRHFSYDVVRRGLRAALAEIIGGSVTLPTTTERRDS
jgi:glycosyltransferase involved in cell wall biosynthesis